MSQRNIIEIGANTGTDTRNLLNQYPDATIYAFEPTHELLIQYLWPLMKENSRLKVIPFAVDNVNGFKTFNVAGNEGCWGVSSLYEFSDNLNENWPGRDDFKVTGEYIVPCITMYDFCNLYNIKEVEYLHIDTQGNDFNCLLSFKEKINTIKAGRCEVAARVELYKNTNNTYANVYNWLVEQNFTIDNPLNDSQACEVDIFFKRI
jgi:FkbM family methyltransferase